MTPEAMLFRFLKQQLDWTAKTPRPGRRRPLDLARHRRLRPAAPRPRPRRRHPAALAAALPARPPHPRPHPPGFRRIRQDLPVPASAPKPSQPGPGRPAGSKNRRPAARHDVDKTVKRTETKAKNQQADRLNNKLRVRTSGSCRDARRDHDAVHHDLITPVGFSARRPCGQLLAEALCRADMAPRDPHSRRRPWSVPSRP